LTLQWLSISLGSSHPKVIWWHSGAAPWGACHLASPSEKKNAMFAKGKSVGEDCRQPPLQRSAVTQVKRKLEAVK